MKRLTNQSAFSPGPVQSDLRIIIAIALTALIIGGATGYGLQVYQRGRKPAAPAVSPAPAAPATSTVVLPTATSTVTVSNADWQTYRNEKFGFELKYPGNLIAREVDQNSLTPNLIRTIFEVNLQRPGTRESDYDIFISAVPFESAVNLGDEQTPQPVYVNNLTVGTKPAVKLVFNSHSVTYLPIRNFSLGILSNIREPDPILDQILSSFHFMDQKPSRIDMSDWVTYKSEKFGIEVAYPRDWRLAETDDELEIKEPGFFGPLDPFSAIRFKPSGFDSDLPEEIDFIEKQVMIGGKPAKQTELLLTDGTPFRSEFTLKDYQYGWSSILPTINFISRLEDDEFIIKTNAKQETNLEVYGNPLYYNTMAEILATVEFFEPTESRNITDWPWYRNDRFGFEIQYPVKWRIAYRENNIPLDEENNSFRLIFAREAKELEPVLYRGQLVPLGEDWHDFSVLIKEKSHAEEGIDVLNVDGLSGCRVTNFKGVPARECLRFGLNDTGNRIRPAIEFDYRGRSWRIAWPSRTKDAPDYEPIYDRIISTFGFIDG